MALRLVHEASSTDQTLHLGYIHPVPVLSDHPLPPVTHTYDELILLPISVPPARARRHAIMRRAHQRAAALHLPPG